MFELSFREDVPYKAAINEAIELAKGVWVLMTAINLSMAC